jgi:hypothetical protein
MEGCVLSFLTNIPLAAVNFVSQVLYVMPTHGISFVAGHLEFVAVVYQLSSSVIVVLHYTD